LINSYRDIKVAAMEKNNSRIMKVLTSGNASRLALHAANKSPLKFAIKKFSNIFYYAKKKERRALINNVTLTPNQTAILKEINENGYAYAATEVDPHLLSLMLDHTQKLQKHAEEIKNNSLITTKKFWLRLSDYDYVNNLMDSENILIKVALQENILKIVGAYLEEAPFIDYVLVTRSEYSDSQYEKSQLWHQDKDDLKLLKLFVYLTDVNSPDDGPFTFFDKKTSQNVKNSFFTRHLDDDEIKTNTKPNQVLAPKLTAFLVDTTQCYHMGSRVSKEHHRLMYTATYVTKPSMYFKKPTFDIPIVKKLSALQERALRE
jgi:hypothetical protein